MLSGNDISIENTDGFIVAGLDSDLGEKLLKLFRVGELEIRFIEVWKSFEGGVSIGELFDESTNHFNKMFVIKIEQKYECLEMKNKFGSWIKY